MTTKIKGYPFEVIIGANPAGAVLADQIKSLDWVARKTSYKAKITIAQLEEIRKKATLLIAGWPSKNWLLISICCKTFKIIAFLRKNDVTDCKCL